MEEIVFLAIPIASFILLFLKDDQKVRKWVMNILLIVNLVFFLSPIILVFLNTPPGKSFTSPSGGSGWGNELWLYLLVFPISGIVLLALMILKIIFATKKNSTPNDLDDLDSIFDN